MQNYTPAVICAYNIRFVVISINENRRTISGKLIVNTKLTVMYKAEVAIPVENRSTTSDNE